MSKKLASRSKRQEHQELNHPAAACKHSSTSQQWYDACDVAEKLLPYQYILPMPLTKYLAKWIHDLEGMIKTCCRCVGRRCAKRITFGWQLRSGVRFLWCYRFLSPQHQWLTCTISYHQDTFQIITLDTQEPLSPHWPKQSDLETLLSLHP